MSLIQTFVVEILLNFPMPFNIILTYANIPRKLLRASSCYIKLQSLDVLLALSVSFLNFGLDSGMDRGGVHFNLTFLICPEKEYY